MHSFWVKIIVEYVEQLEFPFFVACRLIPAVNLSSPQGSAEKLSRAIWKKFLKRVHWNSTATRRLVDGNLELMLHQRDVLGLTYARDPISEKKVGFAALSRGTFCQWQYYSAHQYKWHCPTCFEIQHVSRFICRSINLIYVIVAIALRLSHRTSIVLTSSMIFCIPFASRLYAHNTCWLRGVCSSRSKDR